MMNLSNGLTVDERYALFAGITGLKPSQAWARVGLPDDRGIPRGFDHTRTWHTGRRYIVTTEPYATGFKPDKWLDEHGWQWTRVDGLSIWYPPYTVFYVCSPPHKGYPLNYVMKALDSNRNLLSIKAD